MKNSLLATLAIIAALGAGCGAAPDSYPATPDKPMTGEVTTEDLPEPQATQAEDAPQMKAYDLPEVAQHATDADCWLAVDGKVYDVTQAVDKHPGGPAILKGCGKDATELFNGVEKHGEQARGFLQNLQIGTLE
jgi:cytochrome b involved in lipid metabolism